MKTKTKQKLKVGQWVRIVRGPWKDKTTTIISISGSTCFGFFCGAQIEFEMDDAVLYGRE